MKHLIILSILFCLLSPRAMAQDSSTDGSPGALLVLLLLLGLVWSARQIIRRLDRWKN